MINVNDYRAATDSETLERAIAARTDDGLVIIPPRRSDVEPERTTWIIDRAILIPENTTIVLRNCTIKLSDRCRDNFFRSANCGLGIADPAPIRNIHIRGEGECRLIGADHPRACGDSTKTLVCPCPYLPEDICAIAPWVPEDRRSPEKLDFWDMHAYSYGTDALDPNESHDGDWRGIGILLANAERFSISNLRIIESHGWGISLECCAYGRVEKIDFDARMNRLIDGMRHNMENQDGINLRNGCHDIIVTDITGHTGDDVVALTTIVRDSEAYRPGGSLHTNHVMPNDWSVRSPDIHDVIIRNVSGCSQLCWIVRLLPCNTRIWNVVVDGIIDTSPDDHTHFGTILLGEPDGAYGQNKPGSIKNVTISNVICHSEKPITVKGYLSDSVITNVVNTTPGVPVLTVERPDGLDNVKMDCTVTTRA